jgi:hypothetical protein
MSEPLGARSGNPRLPGAPASLAQIRADRRALLQHWETWVGLLLCGLLAGAGGYLSAVYFHRSFLPLLIGGGIGGYVYYLVTRYVRSRYALTDPAKGGIEATMDMFFREEPAGRVMVPEAHRSRFGYRVHSAEQERLMRAYLRMRLWAQTAVILLGVVAAWFAIDLRHRWNALENPGDGAQLLAIVALAYFILVVAPVLLLQRTTRKIDAEYFPAADRVAVTPLPVARTARVLLILIALGLLLAAALLFLAVHQHHR